MKNIEEGTFANHQKTSGPYRNSVEFGKQAGKYLRPIIISPQRRSEKKKITEGQGHLRTRVHFRIPKTKKQRSFAPIDGSAREIQMWLIAVLVPLSWEIWAFPFRLAFCDIEHGKALFVYHVDIACDVMFVFDMIGVRVIPFGVRVIPLLHCTCESLFPMFLPLTLGNGGGITESLATPSLPSDHLLCKYLVASAISSFETYINLNRKSYITQQNSSYAFRPALTRDS